MLTDQEILANKDRFLNLVQSITREGIDKERLISKLTNSDFFEAPASTIYHSSFKGGLCAHCLSVYDILCSFMQAIYPDDLSDEENPKSSCPYSEDTIKIVALFHDFDKMNKYELSPKNQKVYSDAGKKKDELGNFDWVSVLAYKRKDAKDTFILGTHGENSVYMTETFIPLSAEEHCAIINHQGIYDNPKLDTSTIFKRYPLACLLHLADMASTFVVESDE